ncbi:MAG: sensor domain-containing diguanylate cyclase [Acidimicrobiales bacterium]|nr:sensor domain-containing diguanylate cyclase [Acidimicrobiales bacterium]
MYRIGFSEASPWLAPGTLILLWFLGLVARETVSTTMFVVWMGGSLAWMVLRFALMDHFGERGQMVRPVLNSALLGAWILWYWVAMAPVGDKIGQSIILMGLTVWWTASTSLLAGNPLAFGVLSLFMTTGPLLASVTRHNPFSGSSWLMLFMAAAIGLTYRDRRQAFLAAVEADDSVRQLADEFSLVFDSVRDGVMVSADGVVVRLNPPMGSQLRADAEEVVGRRIEDLLGQGEDELLVAGTTRIDVPRADGSTAVLEITGRVNPTGDRIVWSSRDVTDLVAREAELAAMVAHDDLTGLANRRAMFELLGELHRENKPTAVLAVDIDGFKQINDRYGHAAGDEVLRCVAMRLEGLTGGSGLVARLGGDEFVIVLACPKAVAAGHELATDLVESARCPLPLLGGEIRVTLSVGVSTSDGSVAPDVLLQEADLAMYAAKRAGRDGWRMHEVGGSADPLPKRTARFRAATRA